MKKEIRRLFIAVIIGIASVPVIFLVFVPVLFFFFLAIFGLGEGNSVINTILSIPIYPFYFLSFGISNYLKTTMGFHISPFITLGVGIALLIYVFMWINERKTAIRISSKNAKTLFYASLIVDIIFFVLYVAAKTPFLYALLERLFGRNWGIIGDFLSNIFGK
ncbi:MAG: hypothetical protein A3C82_02155 [Candidatus Wildermuthbacteria bacterium RIFCSPHIGHO2_02_FULL_47_12]|uniref:Uncharacterized protein n=1 Tax=Candidatus Wildermuthbacteria bacterium RIFCSPHIGHO2_02_FULL_47_12 TaxID=1802451 RepID=A0A1G2R197_9BACT|nr:MAG: hypothetical protein A3C82_02155 [Candidatus Wildermuthbacteria bacterium RIFCSPHIGHO2_02_FULL_47_12]